MDSIGRVIEQGGEGLKESVCGGYCGAFFLGCHENSSPRYSLVPRILMLKPEKIKEKEWLIVSANSVDLIIALLEEGAR